VANTQELTNNFTFDSTDEDGLFMFVGMGSDQAIYVWRKTGVVENPQDIPATLGCWKFFSSTQKSDSFELANWTLTKALITNGISQNRVDLKSYVLVSWDDILPRLIPVINANEITEESYNFEVGNSELLTNFSYISSQHFKASLDNQKLAPDEEKTLTDFNFINKQLFFQALSNRNEYLVKDDNNYSSLDSTTLALQIQKIKLFELRNFIEKFTVNGLCDYGVIGVSFNQAKNNNTKIDYISSSSLLTNWGYVCLLRL
jgi:hypothetical protein